MTAPIKVADDKIASERASVPLATKLHECNCCPCFLTHFPKKNFTKTAIIITPKLTREYSAFSGVMILRKDSFREVKPAIRMITPIITDEKYSILPYPKGWSLSGALEDNLVPTIVIREESASLRLFTASKITARECAKNPTPALNPTNRRFTMIP